MRSKAEKFTLEGYNSRIRHYLASIKQKKILLKIKNYAGKIIALVDDKIKQSKKIVNKKFATP